MGGGSMTGLPIIETKAGDVSAYIPTNVISITDGQIYLQSDLFNANVRPAIDVGVSVSRVGGAAQIKAMKSVAGRLKLDLAQFRAMEAFAMFASDLDPASRAQLAKGARLIELLKQKQASPMPVEEQVVVIWAGTTGQLDEIPVGDIKAFEEQFLDYLRRQHAGLLSAIRESKKYDDDTQAGVQGAIDQFKKEFLASGKDAVPLGHEPEAGALGADEVEQVQIVKQKR
jgi:F-type H+-transporting ATPase subunit alpha